MNTRRGRLITLEGGEGAGKSTLLTALVAYIEAHGMALVQTREPGGTALGEQLRSALLNAAAEPIFAETELLLMFAARAQHVRQVILPQLEQGTWVLCDRFTDASYAYQGGGRGQPQDRIAQLESWACAGLVPDVTLLLDLPVSTGRARAAVRGEADRIERESNGFFERVRKTYLERAIKEPQRFHVIDATQTPTQVQLDAIAALQPLLNEGTS